LEGLEEVSKTWNFPTIISTHPRTRERIKSVADLRRFSSLNFHEPLGFFDFIKLQKESFCVLSDSGSISEESAILNFPAITIRDSMERPEALTSGSIIMTGLETGSLIEGIRSITSMRGQAPKEYLFSNPTEKVLKLIKGTIWSFEEWSGVRGLQGFSS
jgi:UDP-N-acetylglucosamine 2-epimerase (non-hydrolysing)